MNHPYVLKLQDFFIEGENDNFSTIYLVLEFGGTDLHKIFHAELYYDEL